MFESYLRWRHTRGFGVHSPYAYRVLTEVITCPHAYYGFREIHRGMTPAHRRSLPAARARMLLRLAVFLRPGVVRLAGDASPLWRVAVKEGYRQARVIQGAERSDDVSLLVAGPGCDVAAMEKTLATGGAVVAFGIAESAARALAENMPEGIGFIAPDAAMLIPRAQTARAVYTINF